jgi:hypothetical protein
MFLFGVCPQQEPISLSQAMRQGLKNPPFLGGKIIVFGDYFY